MEAYCAEQLQAAERELSGQQEEVKKALTAIQSRTSQERSVLDKQQAELHAHVESSRQLVCDFLQEELQQDVPTGKPSHQQHVSGRVLWRLVTKQLCRCLQVTPHSVGSLSIPAS